MIWDEFQNLVNDQPDGVVLLEGRRSIAPEDAAAATTLASALASRFPALRFRSGNATGSDEAFSAGVVTVDASRLQVVAPYGSHRRSVRYDNACYDSPESLSELQEESTAWETAVASPANKRLIERRHDSPRAAAKARYLIRDTMKVLGHSQDFPSPIAALFVVDLAHPEAGGTGHTIRVCRMQGVPFAFQDEWCTWQM